MKLNLISGGLCLRGKEENWGNYREETESTLLLAQLGKQSGAFPSINVKNSFDIKKINTKSFLYNY